MNDLLQLDRSVFAGINAGWSNPVFDVLMPWVSHSADPAAVPLWIVFIGLLIAWRLARSSGTDQPKGRYRAIVKTAVLACLYMALIYGVNAWAYSGLKHLVHRPRPFVQQTVILRVSPADAAALGNDRSFPSGHAANAFMVAALLSEWLRRKRYCLYGMAAWVALSRIYLGVHYTGDVLVGACLGFSITWLMLFFYPLKNVVAREYLSVPHK
jgi:undecaprenyl-diphosphatase